MTAKTQAGALIALLCAAALSGCISLLPKQKPVPLYRFGASPPSSPQAPAPSQPGRVAIRLAPVGFSAPSAGDRILTIEGDRASYVGGGRWLAPAAVLFEGAVTQAFDAGGGPARLVARGEIAPVAYILKLDVRRFEARYEAGAGAPPVVVVEVYAALDPTGTTGPGRSRLFTARAQASDNRIGGITEAFDKAVGEAIGQIVAWSESGAAA